MMVYEFENGKVYIVTQYGLKQVGYYTPESCSNNYTATKR